jgi:hypothetical protein
MTRAVTASRWAGVSRQRREVPVQRGGADAHPGGDLLHRGGVVAALAEHLPGGLDDQLLAVVRPGGRGRPSGHRDTRADEGARKTMNTSQPRAGRHYGRG